LENDINSLIAWELPTKENLQLNKPMLMCYLTKEYKPIISGVFMEVKEKLVIAAAPGSYYTVDDLFSGNVTIAYQDKIEHFTPT